MKVTTKTYEPWRLRQLGIDDELLTVVTPESMSDEEMLCQVKAQMAQHRPALRLTPYSIVTNLTMPESPDFESIARAMLEASDGEPGASRIAEQLRLVWNTRGAADIALLDQTLGTLMGIQAAGPYVKNLDRALRALDR